MNTDEVLGVISDTHGLIRSDVITAFAGVSGIVHAGDVGEDHVLHTLAALAPVTAVKGNMDRHHQASLLETVACLEWAGLRIAVVHDLSTLPPWDPAGERVDVVVFGHSHRAEITWRNGLLYFNPGSAGPRRFGRPAPVGLLTVDATGRPRPQVIQLHGD